MSQDPQDPGRWPPPQGEQPHYPAQQPPQYPPQYPPQGAPPYPPYGYVPAGPVPVRSSGMAVASMIMGILTFVPILPLIAPILAIAFARIAKRQIATSGGAVEGSGMATAGQVMGIIGLAITVLFVVILVAVIIVAASHANNSTSLGLLG